MTGAHDCFSQKDMITVLYIHNEDFVTGGSTKSLENLLHSVRDRVQPIVLVRAEGAVSEYFRSRGYECIVVPFRRSTYRGGALSRALRYLPHLVTTTRINSRCVETVCAMLKDRGVKIVHSNSSVVDIGPEIAARLGAAHVWHLREYFDLGLKARPFRGFARWRSLLEGSDAVIAISSALKTHLGLDSAGNAYCLPDAVCEAADTCLVEEKSGYFVMCAGRWSPVKCPEVAIAALAASHLAEEGFRLMFVGGIDPSYEAELHALAGRLGVDNALVFKGPCDSVKPYVSRALAYLMCSEFEGLGRVTVEAMFYGCPVIARKSGGTLEIVRDRENGFFFDTVGECAALMREMSENTPQDVVSRAQEDAVSRFSEEAFGKKLLEIYESVLDGRDTPGETGTIVKDREAAF